MNEYIKNPLMIMEIKEIVKKPEVENDWIIKKDRFGAYMVFYKNIPAEEIIFAVGEISLTKELKTLFQLQHEYYEEGYADTYNIAIKLIRDDDFSKQFYQKYKEFSDKL